ncbi:hypothetical protein ACWDVV_36165, partial [Streptomyces tendae]
MAFGWIEEQDRARREAGLVRVLRPRPAASPLLDLASNDYLGLARGLPSTSTSPASQRSTPKTARATSVRPAPTSPA